MPVECLIVAYYTKALHNNIVIWVKRSKKSTLLASFEEGSQIEKDILTLKDNSEVETASSSKKKIEIFTRSHPAKIQPENLDLESLQKYFQKTSNQFIDLKRSTEEAY
jgi:hypothetical protein